MIDRIKLLIDKENENASSFADKIGISRSSMNHILNGRNNPSLDMILKILKKYNTIHTEWLLWGNLPMYKTEKKHSSTSLFEEFDKNEMIIQAQQPTNQNKSKDIITNLNTDDSIINTNKSSLSPTVLQNDQVNKPKSRKIVKP